MGANRAGAGAARELMGFLGRAWPRGRRLLHWWCWLVSCLANDNRGLLQRREHQVRVHRHSVWQSSRL